MINNYTVLNTLISLLSVCAKLFKLSASLAKSLITSLNCVVDADVSSEAAAFSSEIADNDCIMSIISFLFSFN